MESLGEFATCAMLAAMRAGDVLKSAYGQEMQISSKPGKLNLVTEYDLLSEKIIVETIKSFFPKHQFLAEEGGRLAATSDASDILWVIDPIDGTVNFAYQIPLFVISIAAIKGSQIITGVIYDPLRQELFLAGKGQGAYLNGKRLTTTANRDIDNAFVLMGLPSMLYKNKYGALSKQAALDRHGVTTRDLGAAALNLAYLAAGRADIYWCPAGLSAWDVAAGKILVEEAGGTVSRLDGDPYDVLAAGPMLAANAFLHPVVTSIFKTA